MLIEATKKTETKTCDIPMTFEANDSQHCRVFCGTKSLRNFLD